MLGLGIGPAIARADSPPPLKHVFVIVLENKGFDETFGPTSPAPYLSRTLTSQGDLLTQYFGIGHNSLDNYVAMVSGQGPNAVTQSDCQTFQDFVGAPMLDADGQALGQGCVYPTAVQTIADQLDARSISWKGYMEDMGTACRHPALNSPDSTQQAKVGDEYAARHDPFVYFHTIIDDPARCDAHVVDFSQLSHDLQSASTTPSFSFITPNLCDDGHDAPCVDGRPGGLVSTDAWLQSVVPQILNSPAMADGMLVVTFDEAETSGAGRDASACCNQPTYPNTPAGGGQSGGAGGGRTGAVVISPYVQPGTVDMTPYNHFALLRSLENVFGVSHLGYAARSNLAAFGPDVYGRAASPGPIPGVAMRPVSGGGPSVIACTHKRLPRAHHRRLPRGAIIGSARVQRRAHRRPRLLVRVIRPARLYVRTVSGRRIGPRHTRGCRIYAVTLPARHGRVRLAASVARGTERRVVRY